MIQNYSLSANQTGGFNLANASTNMYVYIFNFSIFFFFNTLLGHIASVNNVVVTVLHLLQALHRRIIVYRILSEIQKSMTHTSECLFMCVGYSLRPYT